MSESQILETLAGIVIEDAQAQCRRDEDRALNESRRVVMEAEDRVAELRRAALDLGSARGRAVEDAEAKAAAREIESVERGAFDALFDRFLRRVQMALKSLPASLADTDRYGAALGTWARHAGERFDGPAEVFTAARDRAAVYGALLATSAEDFHVQVDHRVHCGFVVRDLDGRTLYDCRPEALVAAHRDELRALLERSVPAPPAGRARQPASADDVSADPAATRD